MNKIALPGPVWLASDLHLGPATPATAEAFLAFLQAAEEEAAALLLPGDIFDAWIGDDVIRAAPPWLATALTALRTTASRIPLWLGRGNRDFLIGEELAGAVGARLLPEPALLQTDYGDVLLTHGDEFCTDDAAYQQFRQMVRNPQWQAAFLAKTIPERLAMAQQARGESQMANQSKSMEIMDVNAAAVEQAFRDSGVALMVHGHTHRPARHVLEVDGSKRERWVLPDWDCDHVSPPRGGWLVIDRDGLQFYDLEAAA
ncbi:UDP-2,3-diacylglucosamine diphosphatase [Achromobacter xylosoxidans]|uniref:UDP-2,3-diacylglucosamine hydrolase n=2 Tax=Alcaligenes xylosoxydans xylosoxydans TaxID=85698 RepID=A0A0D6IB16_ALCXX|nr:MULTISPECIES: UDP-2,3-diacylglucosamine diphosphatase [Achromobacter]AHC48870.1 UDP-2,3-diacylglucosamine hydrolase [Achromobacter xylosoxidans NBRC 15126 = ATCC 27061]AMH04607.1 UDP-2,3-diacylglucosamine diphosphatase [Achromobacter xylosoxidans]AXA79159.1 UDP-2,3-diacylglucosamine diphosphatase [Achromobacter xylosoxidans]EFV85177.1 UDP-2,3-diacylglucosamine hydrolase [Achromobacter xylosoxidans C54]KAA5926242.1 UDP-2,3-diacylglucosamine diphosphatase [Achromobacter xylosoxidans]